MNTNATPILRGLSEIAADYDSLICDVWGVLHDGQRPDLAAAEALRRFRAERGPVVLLSNAPRLAGEVRAQFDRIGVPEGFYDAIITSGEAARADLVRRCAGRGRLALFYLGPQRDSTIFAGLPVACVPADEAELVLCTGLFDDETETPADYATQLDAFKARNLPFLCANPDLIVQRGERLVYCAGAIARLYEDMGGEAVYYGKPYAPVFQAALAALRSVAPARRPLVIGDGPQTDIKGANAMELAALFIGGGIHGAQSRADPGTMCRVLEQGGLTARAAMVSLAW